MLLLAHASIGRGRQILLVNHGSVDASSLAIYLHVQWQDKRLLTRLLTSMRASQSAIHNDG